MIDKNCEKINNMPAPLDANNLNLSRSGGSVASLVPYSDAFSVFLIKLPGCALFFMILCFPTIYPEVKLSLLVPTLLICAVAASTRRGFGLHPSVSLAMYIIVLTGIVFVLLGAVHDTPGWQPCSKVYILWPLVYAIILAGGVHGSVIRDLARILVIALILVAGYSIIHVLHSLGYYPSQWYFEFADVRQTVTLNDGYIKHGLQSISSLIFLVPFASSALIVWPADRTAPVGRKSLLLATLLGFAAAILTGRRMLCLVILATPVLTLLGMRFLPSSSIGKKMRKLLWLVVVFSGCSVVSLLAALTYSDVTSTGLQDGIIDSLVDIVCGESNDVRIDQFWVLLEGWAESPLFGNGIGAQADAMIRDSETPWGYELSYLVMLFSLGLVGFAVYALFVRWIYRKGIAVIRSGGTRGMLMLPVLVGTTSFLLANAVDPYLGKFDGLWVIFLPLGIINDWLLHRQAPPRKLRRQYLGTRNTF